MGEIPLPPPQPTPTADVYASLNLLKVNNYIVQEVSETVAESSQSTVTYTLDRNFVLLDINIYTARNAGASTSTTISFYINDMLAETTTADIGSAKALFSDITYLSQTKIDADSTKPMVLKAVRTGAGGAFTKTIYLQIKGFYA